MTPHDRPGIASSNRAGMSGHVIWAQLGWGGGTGGPRLSAASDAMHVCATLRFGVTPHERRCQATALLTAGTEGAEGERRREHEPGGMRFAPRGGAERWE